jgi:transcriptional regulator with XRE-family HTH domain
MKPEFQSRAHKNEAVVLKTLHHVTGKAVAEIMEVSETTVSRFKNGELKEWAAFLAALGLKIVREDLKCYDKQDIEAVLLFARRYMHDMKDADQLTWEEDE